MQLQSSHLHLAMFPQIPLKGLIRSRAYHSYHSKLLALQLHKHQPTCLQLMKEISISTLKRHKINHVIQASTIIHVQLIDH